MITDTAIEIDEIATYRRLRAAGNDPISSWGRALQHRELRLALESGTARIVRFEDECRNGVYYLRAKLEQLRDGEWVGVDGSYFEITLLMDFGGVAFTRDEARRYCEQRMLFRFAWTLALSNR